MNLKFIARNETLGEALRDIAESHPKRTAMIFGEQRTTFAELQARVESLAGGLRSLGIMRGDKVGLILPNCPEFVYLVFALASMGATAVPMSVQSGAREIRHILNDAEAVAVVTDVHAPGTDVLSVIEDLRPSLPNLRYVISRDREPRVGVIAFDSLLLAASSTGTMGAQAEPADIAMILYTSGTTGEPKGAMHSHRTVLRALRILVSKYREQMTPSRNLIKVLPGHLKTARRLPYLLEALFTLVDLTQLRLLVLTPFYHVAGYFQIMLGILADDELIVMERFHPEKALELIQKERITLLFAVPPMLQAMLTRPNFKQYDLSSVILTVTGAMPVPPPLVHKIRENIGGFVLILYGATEMAVSTVTVPIDATDKQEQTVGRADFLDGVEVRVVDEARRLVPPGTVGEIAVRAPTLMEGYYRRPEATAEAIDDEGWYYSGDLGVIDAEGYVKVLGRRGDMIIRAGANIYPAEIENFLLTHPQIDQVAVIGLPSPTAGGEKVRAYVVPKAGATLAPSDVLSYCWGQIAAYKVPDDVVFVEELPVTSALQKVQHYKLRLEALKESQ